MNGKGAMGAATHDEQLRAQRLAMLSALADNDVALARRIATRLLDDGVTFDEIVDKVFAPVQQEFGDRWATGDLGIADEHAASAAVVELLAELSAVAEAPSGPTVVVATSEHDSHALGARVVAATLALDGFRSVFLGGAIPPNDLAEYVEAREPIALALSCSISAGLASAANSIAVAHELGVPVVAGGRALPNPPRAERLGADAHAASAREAADVLHRWATDPPQALRAAPPPIPEHASLRRRAAAIVAAALDGAGDDAERPDRLAEEIGRLLHVVESAVLLDEVAVIVDHLEWLRTFGPVHGVSVDSVDRAVTEVVAALDGDLVRLAVALESSFEQAKDRAAHDGRP